MAKTDPYTLLGVNKTAGTEEIKRAFRKLARQYHPDVNKSKGAEARFKEVSEAYEILSDPEKRRSYDLFGYDGVHGGEGFGSSSARDPFGGTRFGNSGFSFNFGNFAGGQGPGIFDDVFSDLFSAGKARRRQARGQDLEYELSLDFFQAYHGLSAVVSVLDRRIDVHVPAGVDSGSRVRVAGHGTPGLRGGPPGDLYLNIKVRPHEYFRRDKNDIYLTVPITFGEAVLGGVVEVPGPDGRLALKIPSGTQSGTNFRFRGKGFPDLKDKRRGDFYVTVHVVVPEHVDPVSRELVAEFERRNPFNPRQGR